MIRHNKKDLAKSKISCTRFQRTIVTALFVTVSADFIE